MRLRPETPTFRRRRGTNGAVTPRDTPRRTRQSPLRAIPYRARSVVLAALFALAALVLTFAYVRSYKASVDRAAAATSVFVAARDIPVGTPGSAAVAKGLVIEKDLPRRSLEPGAVTERGQIARLIASERIYAGEQVNVRQFKPAAERGIRGDLNGAMRAIVVPGDPNQLLAGIVVTGDRVDVVATLEAAAGGTKRTVANVILRDLSVLRAPAVPESDSRKSDSSIVLALTDRQLQKLWYAVKHGTWALALRPVARAADSPDRRDVAESVVGLEDFVR